MSMAKMITWRRKWTRAIASIQHDRERKGGRDRGGLQRLRTTQTYLRLFPFCPSERKRQTDRNDLVITHGSSQAVPSLFYSCLIGQKQQEGEGDSHVQWGALFFFFFFILHSSTLSRCRAIAVSLQKQPAVLSLTLRSELGLAPKACDFFIFSRFFFFCFFFLFQRGK